MRTRNGGWPFPHPPNTDFDINLNSPQADGLVFWLPLFGPRRVPYLDRVNGLELTPYNSPVWTPDGWIGNALVFNSGDSEYLEVDSAPASDVPFTMACWFYSTADTYDALMWLGDKDNQSQYHSLYLAGHIAGDPIGAATYDGGSATASTTTGYSLSTWHHACGVWTSATSRAAFIDGGSKGTDATNLSPSGLDRVAIAALRDSSPTSYMDGRIADARIYNRALCDEEVAELYNPRTRWELYQPRVPLWNIPWEPAATTVVGGHTQKKAGRGWPFHQPPNCDFDINLNSEQARGLIAWVPPAASPARLRNLVTNEMYTPSGNAGSCVDPVLGVVGEQTSGGFTWWSSSEQGLHFHTDQTFHVVMMICPTTLPGLYGLHGLASRREYDDTDESWGINLYNNNDDGTYWIRTNIRNSADTAGTYGSVSNVPMVAGTWYQVSGWHDAVNDTIGASCDDAIGTYSPYTGGVAQSAAPLKIGNFSWANSLIGKFADFRIYNRVLSAEELRVIRAPETRWELYQPRVPLWGITSPLAGATAPVWVSPANHAVMGATPTLEFTPAAFTGNEHFNIEMDKVNTFDGGDLRSVKTNYSVTGWQYWDGDSWETFPSAGLPDTYSGNDVRYTVQDGLSVGTWYRRVRQG